MGAGLGAFLTGAGQGYDDQSKIVALQNRDKRETEAHGIAMKNAKLDLNQKQNEADYQNELKASMAELTAAAKPQQITDETTGQVTEKPGMDPIKLQLAAADRLKEVAFKYGKVDLKMLNEARDFGRKIKSEGALEAMQYAQTNPDDQAGIRKMFNERGNIKLGDDIQIGMKDGMFGPTVYGYKLGPKGEKMEVFDGFRDIIMPSMTPEAYAQTVATQKITEVKEKGENVRLGASLSSAENIAARKTALDRNKLALDAQKELNEIVKTRFTGIFRNPLDNAEAGRQKKIEGAVARRAEEYYGTGKVGLQEAFDRAQTDVFRDYNVDTSELAPKKK